MISAWGGATVHCTSMSVAPECRTALFMASWAMRSSSASTSGRSRWVLSSRVTWIGTPEPALRCRASEPMAVPRLSFSPTLVRSVRTDARTSPTTLLSRSRSTCRRRASSGDVGTLGHDVVDQVAQRRHLLGHPVVHLAGQAAALLDRRGVAEGREQQRGVEVHDVGLEAWPPGAVSVCCEPQRHGVQAGGQEAGDHRDGAGPAAQRAARRRARRPGSSPCRSARSARSSAARTSLSVPPWSLMIGVSCSPRGTWTTSPAPAARRGRRWRSSRRGSPAPGRG